MSEIINGNPVFSLKEVAESIKRTLQTRYTSAFWVRAEMNRLNFYRHSGHCYPDLVQKSEGSVIAQIRAVMWSSDYQRINRNFVQTTGEPLREGITMLFRASIQFDANHGLSLQIHDIDPVYALGELEREKLETIQKLKVERLFGLNAQKSLPLLVKRLAIVSVSTSKGLADFEQVLRESKSGYQVDLMLFPSLLQGEKAALQIERQLECIASVAHHFDAVAIIRGGGSDVGLTAFNDFRLASAICRFPLPVLTGIGHATNLTVVEMVAHTHAITPTKLAEIILQRFEIVDVGLDRAAKILTKSLQQIRLEQHRLETVSLNMKGLTLSEIMLNRNRIMDKMLEIRFISRQHMHHENNRLGQMQTNLESKSGYQIWQTASLLSQKENDFFKQIPAFLVQKFVDIDHVERLIELSRPEKILKRGFSIVYHNGRALTDVDQLHQGDTLDIRLAEGRVVASATEIYETNQE